MTFARCLFATIATTLLLGSLVSAQRSSQSSNTNKSATPKSLLASPILSRLLPSAPAGSASTADIARILAATHLYNFLTADFPGADATEATGVNAGKTVGIFSFGPTQLAFTFNGSRYAIYSVPGATVTIPFAINANGQIAGGYADSSNVAHGFVDTAGTITTIDFPGAVGTVVTDANSSGQLSGYWQDASTIHGFFYDGTNFTSLDPPGSTFTEAAGVNSADKVVGIYDDASNVEHGFIYLGGVYSTLDPPSSTSTTAFGINDNGVISGSYIDSSSVTHGFLYLNGVFNTVDVPGASGTALTHINNKNRFAGGFFDQAASPETHSMTGH
jgi:uncharacterized membrane protein